MAVGHRPSYLKILQYNNTLQYFYHLTVRVGPFTKFSGNFQIDMIKCILEVIFHIDKCSGIEFEIIHV